MPSHDELIDKEKRIKWRSRWFAQRGFLFFTSSEISLKSDVFMPLMISCIEFSYRIRGRGRHGKEFIFWDSDAILK